MSVASFLTFTFHLQRSVKGVVGSLMITSLHIYCWVCRWKNCKNRSKFAEVMGKRRMSCFGGCRLI